MSKEPFRVTDHALIRYLERAMGLNIEIVREHIAGICRGPAAIGAVSVRSEGVRFEIRNNTVLTVAPDRQNPSNTGRAVVQDQIQRKKREQDQNIGIRRTSWLVADCAIGNPSGRGAGGRDAESGKPATSGIDAGPCVGPLDVPS